MSTLPSDGQGKQGKSPSLSPVPGPRPVEPTDRPPWTDSLLREDPSDSASRPLACLANAMTALSYSPVWTGRLAYDSFGLRIMLVESPPWQGADWSGPRAWTDTDNIHAANWLQGRQRIIVSPSTAGQAVQAISSLSSFHPVREYLNSLQWDGEERLDFWLSTCLSVEFSPLSSACGARFLISMVARVFNPGCQVDTCLILEGGQGKRKSTALRTLVGNDHWFTSRMPDLRDKDAYLQLRGKWLIEFAELSVLGSHGDPNREHIKNFLTSLTDYYRLPYGHYPEDVPRQTVFAGTTNRSQWHDDETGARRFWPFRIGSIDIPCLNSIRDQLWAEAAYRYHAGEKWYLDTESLEADAEEAQSARYEVDVWEDQIARWLGGRAPGISTSDVLSACLGRPIGEHDMRMQKRVVNILRRLGWEMRRELQPDGTYPRLYRPKTTESIGGQ